MVREITCRLMIISIVLIVSVFGCAHVVTVEETYTSTGQKGYVIDCSGDSDTHLVMHNPTWSDCYTKAGQICGDRGYEILERSDQQGSLSGASVSTTRNQGIGTAFGVTKYFRGMIIKCNEITKKD